MVCGNSPLRFVRHAAAALLLLVTAIGSASADDFKTPGISIARVEWRTALDQFKSEIRAWPDIADRFTFKGQRRLPPSDPRTMPALMQLNAITLPIFSGINQKSSAGAAAVRCRDVSQYARDRRTSEPIARA